MFNDIVHRLIAKGWTILIKEQGWLITSHPQRPHTLFCITIVFDQPQALDPPLIDGQYNDVHALVLCPNGMDSEYLKPKHRRGVQFWFWDVQSGQVFPYPPNKIDDIRWFLTEAFAVSSSNQIADREVGSNEAIVEDRPAYITISIMIINIVVFVLMTLAGGTQNPYVLALFGAKVNSLIQEGQIWRLFTSNFIHIGIVHLGFNSYALWVLGRLCEQLFGKLRFIFIYICSGIGGALLSYLFSPSISAGASGAIFGLLGSLLIYSLNKPQLLRSGIIGNLVAVILANFIFGLLQRGIDNYAHFGGLLVGSILGLILFGINNLPFLKKNAK